MCVCGGGGRNKRAGEPIATAQMYTLSHNGYGDVAMNIHIYLVLLVLSEIAHLRNVGADTHRTAGRPDTANTTE